MDLVSVIGAVVVALATLFGGHEQQHDPDSTELARLRDENTRLWRVVARHGLEDEVSKP